MLPLLDANEPLEPQRPAGMPESALWNPSLEKWEVVPAAGAGAPTGECLRYRVDGTLFSRTSVVDGVEEGPFTIYHPDGSVAREGRFTAGLMDGLVRAFASDDPSGEPLRSCCVPPGAARFDIRFRSGEMLAQIFFDGAGRELLSDGSPCPPRPASLPEMAVFEEGRRGWCARVGDVDCHFDVEGRLVEELEALPDGHRLRRAFDAQGTLVEEQRLALDGRFDGPFRRRFAPDRPSPYADARVREERGELALGQPIGRWTLHDAAGTIVRTIDRGLPFDMSQLTDSPAFAHVLGEGWTVAEELAAGGRVRESLCAAARAAARDGARARLRSWLTARVAALAPEAESRRGEELLQLRDMNAAEALDALVAGADAAAVFRVMATMLPGSSAAARDLVEASLLLAPERRMTHLTRGLIRAEHGDESGARADAAVVAAESPEAAESLNAYLRVVFRPFDPFPPARERLVPDPALGVGVEAVTQPLEAVQRIVAVYATRIERARSALQAMGVPPGAAWMPPDVSGLLPDGPVALIRERIVCDPGEGQPPASEPEFVEVDEESGLRDIGAATVLANAHADYLALGWLCFAAGLNRIGLPTAVSPPETVLPAMHLIVSRHWRARDRANTGGLMALTKGIAGFEWEGMAIDDVPGHVTWMVIEEYLAARSMFLWLASPDALTPFQDDIRAA